MEEQREVNKDIAQAAKELHFELIKKFDRGTARELLIAAMPVLTSIMAQPRIQYRVGTDSTTRERLGKELYF
ncbi:hypothetical protein YDYSY3_57750 [Paenibacillus chitinolyticus]|uniref:hypothetical protein n=1 Tax=Paenibacillus chitinolyticus TaxID=79263 RepID=UPI0026E4E3F1|nr:hypothetical protein [Paenibacillus chitinolyticus]GKS14775.1 hypothetical protein YDYSY3_57750 [Paenibacillus chitinolyticus]